MHLYQSLLCLFLAFLIPTVSAVQAAAADDEKPSVFVNTASDLGNISGTNFGLSRFSEIVRENGFSINHGLQPGLVHGSPLEGIDVYIFLDTNINFTNEDNIALRQWVRAGGILLIGEWREPAPAAGFFNEFGLELLQFIEGTQSLTLPNGSPLLEPKKINSMIATSGRPFNIIDDTRAEAILRYQDGTIAMTRSISHAGHGEVIAIGCSRLFFNTNIVLGDIDRQDNDELVQNMFIYIKNKFDIPTESYDLKLIKLKTRGGNSFIPGEEIRFVAKIRNLGTLKGEDTRIAFYIERIGAAPSARIEVSSATVPAIAAKKRLTIVKRTFLPEELKPGTYQVIAVIDPDKLTADSKIGNNSSIAKKNIVIE